MARVLEWLRLRPVSFRAWLSALVIAGLTLAAVLSRHPPVKASAIGARLELAAGDVTLKRGNEAASVSSGIPLPSGAELATGKGARAMVRLSDGSVVLLRGDSSVTLSPQGLELGQGELWIDAPRSERGSLVYQAADLTLSAADAGLSLRRAGSDVTVYVARGLALLTSPAGRAEVNAGEQATVAAGAAPKIAPLAFWEDWTGGLGDHRSLGATGSGSGRIYGIDRGGPPGAPARSLEISRQAVHAVVRDGFAETEVDQTFSNPGGRELEGWYWFSVPERAIVTSFALETDGVLVEGEVIERQEAAARYQRAITSQRDPALLEWIDGKSYRARVFPIPASGSRRVVLRYMELVDTAFGKLEYVYPMRSDDAHPASIGEFSLSVDLGDAGVEMHLSTLADAVVEDSGRKVTMRRSGFAPRSDFLLEGSFKPEGSLKAYAEPLRVARFAAGGDRADYVMARYVPDIDWASVASLPGDLAVVVDTSASGDEAARQQKTAAAEAILRALSPSDHFTLLALDTSPTILYPKEGLAEATDKEIAAALERLAEHSTGGATDLGALFDASLGRLHGKEQPAVIYIGDGIPTSGEVSADKLVDRLRRSLAVSRARFFTVAVGAQANHALLHELARAGGGQSFRIDDAASSTTEVLRLASAIKTPTITDLEIDLGAGLDEPMISTSGKVPRGEEVVLLARSHHPLPDKAAVRGRLAGKDFVREYRIAPETGIGAALVPRLWATEKVRRLLGQATDAEAQRGKIVELGLEYGLVTPFTSVLALDSEQAYRQQGIKRRASSLRGVRLTSLEPATERAFLDEQRALTSPITAMGCAKSSPESAAVDEAPRAQGMEGSMGNPGGSATPADNKEGGTGTRAKSEEAALPSTTPIELGFGAGDSLGMGRLNAVTAGAAASIAPQAAPAATAAPANAGHLARPTASASVKPTPPPPPAAITPHALALDKDAKKLPPGPPPPLAPIVPRKPIPPMSYCSDTAQRPLAERVVVWAQRLRHVTSADELLARYDGARVTCEIPDWRAESALLELIQAKVDTEGAATALLDRFSGARETQKFIAHSILRRTVDPHIVAVVRRVLFQDHARWVEIDNDLAALPTTAARIAKMRELLLSYPDDPEATIRLVRYLADDNQREEALSYGHRLRDRGFMSPALAMDLGDVLARAGYEDDAIRTYSEIVEFNPNGADSRRLLGDVYLRHGWYPAAYRQYQTLIDLAPSAPEGWLRMASAAAGGGRIDEALRLQRQIATAEGTPGPNDPRMWARLLSAARLGRLLADPAAAPGQGESVSRKLKELELWSGPAALVILTWEDYGAALGLVSRDGLKEASIGEVADGLPVGLTSVELPAADLERLRWSVRWRNDPPARDVAFVAHRLVWDGKAFAVKVQRGTLGAKDQEVAL